MMDHPVKIDELKPIVEQLNKKEITYGRAIELIAHIAHTKGYILPLDSVSNSGCQHPFKYILSMGAKNHCLNCGKDILKT